jgi:hypothetical protein
MAIAARARAPAGGAASLTKSPSLAVAAAM